MYNTSENIVVEEPKISEEHYVFGLCHLLSDKVEDAEDSSFSVMVYAFSCFCSVLLANAMVRCSDWISRFHLKQMSTNSILTTVSS